MRRTSSTASRFFIPLIQNHHHRIDTVKSPASATVCGHGLPTSTVKRPTAAAAQVLVPAAFVAAAHRPPRGTLPPVPVPAPAQSCVVSRGHRCLSALLRHRFRFFDLIPCSPSPHSLASRSDTLQTVLHHPTSPFSRCVSQHLQPVCLSHSSTL